MCYALKHGGEMEATVGAYNFHFPSADSLDLFTFTFRSVEKKNDHQLVLNLI